MRRHRRETHWYYRGGAPPAASRVKRRWRRAVARSHRLAGQIHHAAVAKWRWTVVLVVLIAAVVTFGYYANPSAGDSGSKVASATTSSVGAPHQPADRPSGRSRAALPDTATPGPPHPKKHPDVAPARLTPGALIAYLLLSGSHGSHATATPAVKTARAPAATPDSGPSAPVGSPSTTETTHGPHPTTTTTTEPPPRTTTTTNPPPTTTSTTTPPPTTTTTTPPTTTTTTTTTTITIPILSGL